MNGAIPFYVRIRRNVAREWFVAIDVFAEDILLGTLFMNRYIQYVLLVERQIFLMQLKHISIISAEKDDEKAEGVDAISAEQACMNHESSNPILHEVALPISEATPVRILGI